ncbi:MAG TPA: hypothetical protein VIU12_00095 [Chryseolinea sp.]
MKHVLFVLMILVISCHSRTPTQNATYDFMPPKRLAELTHTKLDELSGLVASQKHPGLLWTHNDSGNGAEIFLVDTTLNLKLTCILPAYNRDWEDIAVGPGPDPGKSYVYVGDIGDNDAIYPLKYIYRFEEPDLNPKKIAKITSLDTITFRLADGKKDSEALMIDPKSKSLYVVSKREKPVYLYELPFPQSTTDTLVAQKKNSLPITQIVSANISSKGDEILMKNYEHIYYWKAKQGETIEKTLARIPNEVDYDPEPQGEAITWAANGSGFYTISEHTLGKKVYLYFYKRK